MSYYDKLVEERGVEGAKEWMRQIRKKRTAPSYFATLSKKEITAISSKGGKAKHAGIKTDQSGQPS